MRKVITLVALVGLAIGSIGCSLVFQRTLPKGYDAQKSLQHNTEPDCTESKAYAVMDLSRSFSALSGGVAVVGATGGEMEASTGLLLTALLTDSIMYFGSSVYGFNASKKCREAVKDWQRQRFN